MTVFKFISEEEYQQFVEAKRFKSMVRLKVFNGNQQTDFEKLQIILVDSRDKKEIDECVDEICNMHFSWAKSFRREIIISEE